LALSVAASAIDCPCDPAKPETLELRQCSLCKEAEQQPKDIPYFFVKDNSPRKPNRLLLLPRRHWDTVHEMAEMTRAEQVEIWTAAINKARTRAGSAAVDDKMAESYAQRAAALLEKLAISRSQAVDVSVAANPLMRALEDPRPQIAVSSANVLAMINSKEAQGAIAAKSLDDKANDELKIATFKALAKSAKFWGNQLDGNTTDALQKVVETNQNLQVRAAAAEAQGALNLPADRAKNLITQQSQVGK